MRIQVRLPKSDPVSSLYPNNARKGCPGDTFKPHGTKCEAKAVDDTEQAQVNARCHRCTTCGRTFRIYPTVVSNAQQSDRLKAMNVLLYILGLSYGGVEDFLTAIGLKIGKTTVYDNVQAAGMVARRCQQSR